MGFYRTILLIDDDDEDQEIFADAVKEVAPEINCLCEDDGEVALTLLSQHTTPQPDLIFIDMNMPRLNGKQVLDELKKNPALRDIPVIMFSTFFGDSDIREIREFGAVHHMLKSTNFNDMCQSLREVLSKKW